MMLRIIMLALVGTSVMVLANHDHKYMPIDSPIMNYLDKRPQGFNVARALKINNRLKAMMPSITSLAQQEHKGHHHTKDKEALEHKIAEMKGIADEGDLLAELREHQKQFSAVVHKWAEQRGRTEATLLLAWADKSENRFIVDDLTSFTALQHFVEDLVLFIGDVVESCPKSKQKLEEFIKKNRQEGARRA